METRFIVVAKVHINNNTSNSFKFKINNINIYNILLCFIHLFLLRLGFI